MSAFTFILYFNFLCSLSFNLLLSLGVYSQMSQCFLALKKFILTRKLIACVTMTWLMSFILHF